MTVPLYHPRPERWPQIGLRGFLLLVMVLGTGTGWVAAQIKWKHDRHDVLKDGEVSYLPDRNVPVPFALRLLGETGVAHFYVQDPGDSAGQSARVRQIRGLFPESQMHLIDMDLLRIYKALDSSTAFEFVDTPLEDAIEYLKEYHGIDIQFDGSTLRKLGISPKEATVTVTNKAIPLRLGLDETLKSLEPRLTFLIKDEVLLITSEQQKEIYTKRQQLAAPRERPPHDAKLLQALAAPTVFEFVDTPLSDAIDYLQDYHQIAIQCDLGAFEKLDLTPETARATVMVTHVSLRSGLNLLLAGIDDSLTYQLQGAVLVITSRETAGDDAADVESPGDKLAVRLLQEALEKAADLD